MSTEENTQQMVGTATLDQDSSPSRTVYLTVAEVKSVDPLDLPPLYDAMDPDAIDSITRSAPTSKLAFAYAGCEVTIEDGEVTVALSG